MDPYEELKRKIDIKPAKRCPQCKALALEYDMGARRIYCTKCGFEENLPK